MSNKLFGNTHNIIEEVWQMERDEHDPREDRSVVSNFFHGQPPYSQSEADALGLNVNVNNLFGYENISTARDQLLSLYTTPPRLWEVELDVAPAAVKKSWEAKATKHWNRIMKDSGRLKLHYEFASGDATMHGEGFLWTPSKTDWCPQHCALAKRLVPAKATMDVASLTHFAVDSELSFRDIVKNAQNGAPGWSKANLKKIIGKLFDKPGHEFSGDARSAIDQQNVEMMTYYRQSNSSMDRMWQYNVPVTFFYQCNFDHPTFAFDLTVLNRNAMTGVKAGNKDQADDAVLFERESYFPAITRAIFPMHMNSAIGGEPLWNRVKGYGHLNYSLSWHLEAVMSRAIQAVHEQGTTFFQAADSASREAMEQILLKHNGIIPENISLVQNRVGGDFQGFLSIMQLMRQQGAVNVNTIQPNNGAEGTNALQVQAIFQQNTVASAVTNRVSHWFDYMNRLGREIWARFTNPLICEWDSGYSEIMEFQAAMQREGIPLKYLQPANVRITTARVVGDGVKQKSAAAAQAMMSNISQYGPGAQQDIRRMFAAVATDDYELAERWVPYDDEEDSDQVFNAEAENNICILQQKPPMIRDKDQDEVHVKVHLEAMAAMIKKGVTQQQSHFLPDQLAAFNAIGAHVVMHVRDRIAPVNKDLGSKYFEELNKLAAMGEKLAHNLAQAQQKEQKQGQDSKEMTPAEIAKLQLEQQKIQQGQQKIDFGMEKHRDAQDLRERQLSLREHQAAAQQHLSTVKDIRDDHMTRQEMAIRDAEAAAGLSAAPQQPGA